MDPSRIKYQTWQRISGDKLVSIHYYETVIGSKFFYFAIEKEPDYISTADDLADAEITLKEYAGRLAAR